jgi:hypothetical protein
LLASQQAAYPLLCRINSAAEAQRAVACEYLYDQRFFTACPRRIACT